MSAHPLIAGRLYWVKCDAFEGPVLASHACDAISAVISKVLA